MSKCNFIFDWQKYFNAIIYRGGIIYVYIYIYIYILYTFFFAFTLLYFLKEKRLAYKITKGVSPYIHLFQILNQLTEVHETSYKFYAIGGHRTWHFIIYYS
jgi:hypothetical protein